MALQVRSVSEPTYEEDGVHYGTPTSMIEKIKELQLKIEDMEERVTRNAHVCKRVPERSRCQLRIRRISNLKSLIADLKILI